MIIMIIANRIDDDKSLCVFVCVCVCACLCVCIFVCIHTVLLNVKLIKRQQKPNSLKAYINLN